MQSKKRFLWLGIFVLLVMSSLAFAVKPNEDLYISAASDGVVTVISGIVYDRATGNPVDKKIYIRVYCEHDGEVTLLKETQTKNDGSYKIVSTNKPKVVCSYGDRAWIEVDFDGQTYKSQEFLVENSDNKGSAVVDTAVGVPEYDGIALGLAILVGGAGFILIRMKN